MNAKEVTRESLENLLNFLKENKLPYKDICLGNNLFVGYYDEQGNLIGSGGLEFYDRFALLRSIAVSNSQRGISIGTSIVTDLLSRAKSKSVAEVYLLTETAHDYFLKFGFNDIDRTSVPAKVQKSTEFSSVCPSSAACMAVKLK